MDARALHAPRPVGSTEYGGMKQVYEALYGKLQNKEGPSKQYMARVAERCCCAE